MRKHLLLGALLLVAGLTPVAAAEAQPARTTGARTTGVQTTEVQTTEAPTAAQLLAKTQSCAQISSGEYKTDDDTSRTVPVCGANGAMFWKADMDIDCDGQRTSRCNEDADPWFQDDTAFHQSDGRPLIADQTPYIVVPSSSSTWNYQSSGLRGAGSCAVIYGDKVLYTVIGDTGPTDIIGEASYATANALGIDPDPAVGGADSGVTYICFQNSTVSPIENHDTATSVGQNLASQFVQNN
jgi:hypothetical protein